MGDGLEYWAFLSYSHADKGWAKWLHRALETYTVPRHLIGRTTLGGEIPKKIQPIFRDRDELPTARITIVDFHTIGIWCRRSMTRRWEGRSVQRSTFSC